MATFTYESIKYALKNPTVSGNLTLSDDGADIYIGADNDLQITHSGSAGTIDCATGNLELQVDASAVISVKDEDGDSMATFTSNGASVLYHNNTATVSTVSGNTTLSGSLASGATTVTGALSVSSTSTFTGAITSNAGVVVDNITIDGTTIALSSGDLTLDAAADIVLDAAGQDIIFKTNGTQFGAINNNNTNVTIISGTTTAATFDGAAVTFAGTLASGAITSSGDVTAFSDMRIKHDIETIEGALAKVSDMRGVYFKRNNGEAGTGVIAQEIENILPEVVKDGEYKSVAYGNMVGILIEAIKELKAEVEKLKESK